MKKINLFCLPFAGGSKYAYRSYMANATPLLQVEPLELPGRGARYHEPLLKDAHEMAMDVFKQIEHRLHEPYAIYGHSMGTIITFLLAKIIRSKRLPQPLHLFLTGAGGPTTINKSGEIRYLLPADAFFAKIKEMGGIDNEILDNPDMTRFFEPILRADFQVVETYRHQPDTPLDIPITVVIGTGEKATREDALAWQLETSAPVEVRQLPGNHFFIFDFPSDIMQLITHQLTLKFINNEQTANLPQA